LLIYYYNSPSGASRTGDILQVRRNPAWFAGTADFLFFVTLLSLPANLKFITTPMTVDKNPLLIKNGNHAVS
jgi:hypothetical protein